MKDDIEYISVWMRLGRNIRKPVNTAATIILAAYTTLWGFWLLSPFWDVFTSAPLYQHMNSLAPESAFGLVAIAVGIIMFWGVLKNSYMALSKSTFVGAIFWFVIAVFYFLGDWHNTGGITSLMICCYCSFIWLNIKVNRDRLHLNKKEDTI